MHRDYRSTSDSIVKIFDDKIEFYNPGGLPEEITIDDLLNNRYKSTPRNKLVADTFKNLGMIEKYGSGIRRVMQQFQEMGLQAPVFQNQGVGFLVTAFGVKKDTDNVTDNVTDNRLMLIHLPAHNIRARWIFKGYSSASSLSDSEVESVAISVLSVGVTAMKLLPLEITNKIMEKITLTIKDVRKKNFFLELIKQFNFIEVQKTAEKKTDNYDFFASA